jgi:hypothetical protein
MAWPRKDIITSALSVLAILVSAYSLYRTSFFKELNVSASVAGLDYSYNNEDLIYTPTADVGIINVGNTSTIITSISLYIPEKNDTACNNNAPNTWKAFIGPEETKTRAAPIVIKPNEASVTRIVFKPMPLSETTTDGQKTYQRAVTLDTSNKEVIANQCLEIVYIDMFGSEKKRSTQLTQLNVYYEYPENIYFGQSPSGFAVVNENNGWL